MQWKCKQIPSDIGVHLASKYHAEIRNVGQGMETLESDGYSCDEGEQLSDTMNLRDKYIPPSGWTFYLY